MGNLSEECAKKTLAPSPPASETPRESANPDICGNTITVTCDELFTFTDDISQPADAWPWPEPPFVRAKRKGS